MDQKIKFDLNFQSIQLRDFSPQLVGKEIYLRFKRNQNDLKTKIETINTNGFAEFNERIEMKTSIEWDKGKNSFAPKYAELYAILNSGQELGRLQLNLSDYSSSDSYVKQFYFDTKVNYIGQNSFINVEIITQDSNQQKNQSQLKKSTSLTSSSGQSQQKIGVFSGSQSQKQLNQLENKIDQLTKDNSIKEYENRAIQESLINLGVKTGISNLLKNAMAPKDRRDASTKKDNTEKYKEIKNIEDIEIKQLVNLDNDIERLFEIQMKKSNKNEEMIRNKINSLNDKPSLRDYLFKKVSNEQLAKDIKEIEQEIEQRYQII